MEDQNRPGEWRDCCSACLKRITVEVVLGVNMKRFCSTNCKDNFEKEVPAPAEEKNVYKV
jgi:hypothetical protein